MDAFTPSPISRKASTETTAPSRVTAYGKPPGSLPGSDGSGQSYQRRMTVASPTGSVRFSVSSRACVGAGSSALQDLIVATIFAASAPRTASPPAPEATAPPTAASS
ncbi:MULTISPECIES: hypothetical protein [unclassified Kribbella]|uniref:hypothetical protein n=1 Tax=unclassified Kribbella TaxID=2644121 RepID=UPI0033C11AA9